jgi:hypothetical protein
VLKLHKAGGSLRGIAEDTSLGLATVRTIVSQKNGTDRTTVKHLERIDPDRAAAARWRARKRTRDALPKRTEGRWRRPRGSRSQGAKIASPSKLCSDPSAFRLIDVGAKPAGMSNPITRREQGRISIACGFRPKLLDNNLSANMAGRALT